MPAKHIAHEYFYGPVNINISLNILTHISSINFMKFLSLRRTILTAPADEVPEGEYATDDPSTVYLPPMGRPGDTTSPPGPAKGPEDVDEGNPDLISSVLVFHCKCRRNVDENVLHIVVKQKFQEGLGPY